MQFYGKFVAMVTQIDPLSHSKVKNNCLAGFLMSKIYEKVGLFVFLSLLVQKLWHFSISLKNPRWPTKWPPTNPMGHDLAMGTWQTLN